MQNIYKINSGEITEKELDLIIIGMSSFLVKCQREKSFRKYEDQTEKLLDKIMRNGA